MAKLNLFAEQTINGFASSELYDGLYRTVIKPPPFPLIIGETYEVTWDGVTYTVVAQDISAMVACGVAIGNGTAYGLPGNNEPFIIVWTSIGVDLVGLDTNTSHTISITHVITGSSNRKALILPEQTISYIESDSDGVYITSFDPYTFRLSAGEIYEVIFDGVSYTVEAKGFSLSDTLTIIVIGNGALAGLAESSDPFLVAYAAQSGEISVALDNQDSHTLAIYQIESDKTNILAPTVVSGFTYTEDYGAYMYGVVPAPFVLTIGETYQVLWDDISYNVVAQDTSAIESGSVSIGNLTSLGLQGNDEPFAVVSTDEGVALFGFDDSSLHDVAIYHVNSEPITIVLKDRDGNDVNYEATRINVLMSDGTEVVMSPGEPVETTIDLDFSAGDLMEVTPDQGQLFNKVDIPKPANLLPENIAKDVTIAGVTGTSEGGGGSDFTNELVPYALHEFDIENNEVRIPYIFFNKQYSDTGVHNYVVNIPDTIGKFNVAVDFQGIANNCRIFYFNNNRTFVNNITSITFGANVLAVNGNMANAFRYCVNLNSPINIPRNATTLYSAFTGCSNFNQPLTIPNTVTNVSGMFSDCNKFNQPITIEDGVTNVFNMFNGCRGFNHPIVFPNSVRTMNYVFADTYYFNQPFTIPCNVTSVAYMLSYASRFNQPVTISEGVTSLSHAFDGAYNFNQPITIPNSVRNITRMVPGVNFGSDIIMNSPNFANYTAITNVLSNNTSRGRVNIYVDAGSNANNYIFNYGNQKNRLIYYTAFTWSKNNYNNCWYNTTYNIYCYWK